LRASGANGDPLGDRAYPIEAVKDVPAAMGIAGEWLRRELRIHPIAVGHRVVHGGPDYDRPVLIDHGVVTRLERFVSLAPLLQSHNLSPIRSILDRFPTLPQVACFDTAFHRTHSAVADYYAIPHQLYAEGVRRYGFHGLSYEYIAKTLPQIAPDIAKRRVIVAHLGSGASMCALKGGQSVESTMGFTALDGLPMGTRLRRQQRYAGARGQRRRQGEIGDRVFRISDRPQCRHACGCIAGPGCLRLHGRHWRKFCEYSRARGRAARMARRHARSRREFSQRAADIAFRQSYNTSLRRADRRGIDDRAACVVAADKQPIDQPQTRDGVMIPVFPDTKVALKGKKGLIVGIANEQSIAWGCARAFRALGSELAVTYLNDRAKKHVEPLAQALEAPIFMPLDVMMEGQTEQVFERIAKEWGRLDFLLHSIAFSPKEALHGRVVDVGRDGFLKTMDVSCWSFMRMAHLAEPLMKNGGTMFTMTYYGSQMVVENYNVMGVAKAALEAAVRYIAAELGPKGIRVHAISPGPLATRAASGIPEFDELMDKAQSKAPSRSLVSIDDVGNATAFLALDGAKLITGSVLYIDGGYHIID
jgi:enoyl-[acyl-carrier protein] reductase I